MWDKSDKSCVIIDICVPLDENIHKQEKEKVDKYLQLIVGLKRIYPDYSYKIIPIVIGATGIVTNSLLMNLNELFEMEKVERSSQNYNKKL